MFQRRFFRPIRIAGLLGGVLLGGNAWAKIPASVREAVRAAYPPAATHKGLWNAAHPIKPDKLGGFVVLLQGSIPAEKAEWFIANTDYDYRPSVLDAGDTTLSTRRGRVFRHLQPGQVLLISDVSSSGNTMYLKLLSADIPRGGETHPSRLACMVGFKFDKNAASDSSAVLARIGEWFKPFSVERDAFAFAQALQSPKPVNTKATKTR